MKPNNVENNGGDCDWKSRVCMTFDTEQEAYDFYNAYGRRLGFSIRRGYVNKSKEGQITSKQFVRNKKGFQVVDKQDPLTTNPRQEAIEIDLAEKSGICLNAAFELMDAQMIMDYGQFGDVVTFDTIYKLNSAHRPFASFVGFNHHRETVIFGTALMYDEIADSFI
ncbi:protein FAR1-RELATED SEQUENCE 7-like [Camellia sinensis]|uniref:protein FAR1-RELATED SEQUENCE 7-like n=1 Tax=Camellia sinensis TaxID=4442 RepID=UPI00103630E4|nr:protein FAR1-RELATED SEQUENCE 7-like [Camellia sinensis]